MKQRRSLKILIILVFCILSKVHAQDTEYPDSPICDCPEGAQCNFEEDNIDCKCQVGYEGENCETWICDEENKSLIQGP